MLTGPQTNGAPHIDVHINKCAIINCERSNSQVAAEPLGDWVMDGLLISSIDRYQNISRLTRRHILKIITFIMKKCPAP